MIRKIISSGQTGVELAALDCAIKLGLAHGGYASRGKRNEDGRLPDHYQVEELRNVGIQQTIEKNVAEADGVLVISRAMKTEPTQLAVKRALELERQFLNIDMRQYPLFEAASLIGSWMTQKQIKIVFVTGPSASQDPLIYEQTKKILETAFYLGFVKTGLTPELGQLRMESSDQPAGGYPQTVEEAVARLKVVLSLKDRATLANMQITELNHLRLGLGEYIKKHFGLYGDNKPLIRSCAVLGGLKHPLADEACSVILRSLWEDLRQTHRLRVIK